MKKFASILVFLFFCNYLSATTLITLSNTYTADTDIIAGDVNENEQHIQSQVNIHNAATTGEHGADGTILDSTSPVMSNPTITGTGTAAFLTVTTSSATVVTGGTVTTDTPPLSITQTWNGSGVIFNGIKANITDTSSHANSLLIDLQIGGTSRFKVDKAGGIFTTTTGTAATAEIARLLNSGAGLGRGLIIRGSSGGYCAIDSVLTSGLTAEPLYLAANGGGVTIGDATLEGSYFLELPNSASQKAKAQAWDTYSDGRLKTEQIPLNYGIKEILKLQPKRYNRHDSIIIAEGNDKTKKSLKVLDKQENDIGLVAQEVYQIIPEAVNKPLKEEETWSLNYPKLIPVLVKAIQEQQKTIDSQAVKISNLEKRLAILEKKVGGQ